MKLFCSKKIRIEKRIYRKLNEIGACSLISETEFLNPVKENISSLKNNMIESYNLTKEIMKSKKISEREAYMIELNDFKSCYDFIYRNLESYKYFNQNDGVNIIDYIKYYNKYINNWSKQLMANYHTLDNHQIETEKVEIDETEQQKFIKIYQKLIDFKNKYDMIDTNPIPEENTELFAMFSLAALPEIKKYIFLSFLLEKEAWHLLTEKEKRELKTITMNIGIQYPTDYNEKITNFYTSTIVTYHVLGLINITDKKYFSKTFEKYTYKNCTRDEVFELAISRKNHIGIINPSSKNILINKLINEKKENDRDLTNK